MKNSERGFVVPLIIGILAVIGMGIFLGQPYFAAMKSTSVINNQLSNVKEFTLSTNNLPIPAMTSNFDDPFSPYSYQHVNDIKTFSSDFAGMKLPLFVIDEHSIGGLCGSGRSCEASNVYSVRDGQIHEIFANIFSRDIDTPGGQIRVLQKSQYNGQNYVEIFTDKRKNSFIKVNDTLCVIRNGEIVGKILNVREVLMYSDEENTYLVVPNDSGVSTNHKIDI